MSIQSITFLAIIVAFVLISCQGDIDGKARTKQDKNNNDPVLVAISNAMEQLSAAASHSQPYGAEQKASLARSLSKELSSSFGDLDEGIIMESLQRVMSSNAHEQAMIGSGGGVADIFAVYHSNTKDLKRERKLLRQLVRNEEAMLIKGDRSTHGGRHAQLQAAIRAIRTLEDNPAFTVERNLMVDEMGATSTYGFANFGYGQLYFHSFHAFFSDNVAAKQALHSLEKRPFVVMGSNVGTEAFFSSLWLQQRTISCELVCGLSDIATDLAQRHAPDLLRSNVLDIRCQDCLEIDVSDAGIIWLDDQVWEHGLVTKMCHKLTAELATPVTVFTFRNFETEWCLHDQWTYHGRYSLAVSWSAIGANIHTLSLQPPNKVAKRESKNGEDTHQRKRKRARSSVVQPPVFL